MYWMVEEESAVLTPPYSRLRLNMMNTPAAMSKQDATTTVGTIHATLGTPDLLEVKISERHQIDTERRTLNRHGETGNGPDADDEHFPTTEKKRSLSYADAARGTKRYVTFE